MDTSTLPAWMDRIQADIEETEWQWRRLDEQAWRARPTENHSLGNLARREREAEAAQLRAELAVAEFLQAFYSGVQSELGRILAAHLGSDSWSDSLVNRQGLAMFLRTDAELAALPEVEVLWGPARVRGDEQRREWWVQVEAVHAWHGEELSRQSYRFHVVGDRVEGWTATAASGQMEPAESGGTGPTSRRKPFQLVRDLVARLRA